MNEKYAEIKAAHTVNLNTWRAAKGGKMIKMGLRSCELFGKFVDLAYKESPPTISACFKSVFWAMLAKIMLWWQSLIIQMMRCMPSYNR